MNLIWLTFWQSPHVDYDHMEEAVITVKDKTLKNADVMYKIKNKWNIKTDKKQKIYDTIYIGCG